MSPDGEGGTDARPRRVRPCPVCGKPATREAWPFCSERCRDVDLHRWLSGSYVIPGREDDEDTSG
ncbi:MAG: DNA gyrase inhibitor YacG [Xanthobacteraceae bacterium]